MADVVATGRPHKHNDQGHADEHGGTIRRSMVRAPTSTVGLLLDVEAGNPIRLAVGRIANDARDHEPPHATRRVLSVIRFTFGDRSGSPIEQSVQAKTRSSPGHIGGFAARIKQHSTLGAPSHSRKRLRQ